MTPSELNVLLLEFAGVRIPKDPSFHQLLKNDLFDMHDELCRLGICYPDLHINNVLWVEEEPEALPGLPSPIHQRVDQFRIIDLVSANFTDLKHKILYDQYLHAINMIIEVVQYGERYY